MLAIVFAASLAAAPQEAVTQAQYNEFKRCQGEWFGFYRTGVMVFGGTQFEADVHEAGYELNELLDQIDDAFAATGPAVDLNVGYSHYQSGWHRWDNWHNRPDAEDVYFDSSPLTEQCNAAIARVAAYVDAR
jgi:hypothetical protein